MDWPTIVHVAGGLIALLMGAVALCVRKGGDKHKVAGHWFAGAMFVMAIPGGVISFAAGKPFDVLSSAMSVYMVATGWAAFKAVTAPRVALMFSSGALCVVGYLSVELYALHSGTRATDAPPGVGYVFATILALAAYGDLRLARGAYDKRRVTIRHLWRMTWGLFVATGSFFGARPHLFPDWMQTYGILLALTFAPVVAMAYWRFRLRARPRQHEATASPHSRRFRIGQDHAGEGVG